MTTSTPGSTVRSFVVAGGLVIVLTACAAADSIPTAAASATPSPSAAASATPQPTPRPAESEAGTVSADPSPTAGPSEDQPASLDGGTGITLGQVDVQRLLDAFASYGFEVDEEPALADDGASLWGGAADGGEVEVVVREVDGVVERVLVADYSAGDVGLDELGFLVGIFAPEATSWLIENAEMAIADPGTPMTEEMDFDNVRLIFEAYTDDTQSIDVYVEEPQDG